MDTGKILVIDDELVMCHLLTDLLKDKGYTVDYAQTGTEGLTISKKMNFDVFITDLRMPDMSGIKVIEELKKNDPDAMIIVITAFGTLETAQKSLRLGAYDYITKPFDVEKISFVVKRAMFSKKLSNQNKKLLYELEKQNVILEKKVQERTKQLTLLYKIGVELSSSLNLIEVVNNIVEKISLIFDADICSILLLNEAKDELFIICAHGLSKEIIENTKIKNGEGIAGWVLQNKQALFIKNIEEDARFKKRSIEKYYTKSLLSIPLITKGTIIGILNINNKKTNQDFSEDDFNFIKEIALEAAIAIENAILFKSLQDTHLLTISALTATIDAKDYYTRRHSEQVTKYALLIAEYLKMPPLEINILNQASRLHDIGKIGIPDYILTKLGKLNDDEWREVKLHPSRGADILAPLNYLKNVITLIKQHHEKYDGTGYPTGVKGEKIEIGARIMAVADSFDAMTSERPYRKKLSLETAIEELKKNRGTQFDPNIVDIFIEIIRITPDLLTETVIK